MKWIIFDKQYNSHEKKQLYVDTSHLYTHTERNNLYNRLHNQVIDLSLTLYWWNREHQNSQNITYWCNQPLRKAVPTYSFFSKLWTFCICRLLMVCPTGPGPHSDRDSIVLLWYSILLSSWTTQHSNQYSL